MATSGDPSNEQINLQGKRKRAWAPPRKRIRLLAPSNAACNVVPEPVVHYQAPSVLTCAGTRCQMMLQGEIEDSNMLRCGVTFITSRDSGRIATITIIVKVATTLGSLYPCARCKGPSPCSSQATCIRFWFGIERRSEYQKLAITQHKQHLDI